VSTNGFLQGLFPEILGVLFKHGWIGAQSTERLFFQTVIRIETWYVIAVNFKYSSFASHVVLHCDKDI
jgi:hypothetical protein